MSQPEQRHMSTNLSEARSHMSELMIKESEVLKELEIAKSTLKWMKTNRFLIPEKLSEDIKNQEKTYQEVSRELDRAIKDFDYYTKHPH